MSEDSNKSSSILLPLTLLILLVFYGAGYAFARSTGLLSLKDYRMVQAVMPDNYGIEPEVDSTILLNILYIYKPLSYAEIKIREKLDD